MITLILATDMARHAEIMDSFKEKMENFDYSNEEHMTLVSGLVFPLWGLVSERHPPAQTANQNTKGKCVTAPWNEASVKPVFKVTALNRESAPVTPAGPPLLVKAIPFPFPHLIRI